MFPLEVQASICFMLMVKLISFEIRFAATNWRVFEGLDMMVTGNDFRLVDMMNRTEYDELLLDMMGYFPVVKP